MSDKYVFFINNTIDYNFNDIGVELFKLGIGITYASKTKKKFGITDISYLKILETFINNTFNIIDIYSLKENYKCISVNLNDKIEENNDNNCIVKLDFSFKLINEDVRDFFTTTIIRNPRYSNSIYNKINEIMNFFNEFDINNYVFIIINKNNYNKNYYEKSYYNYFSNCKLLILTDDINWAIKNIDFININKCYFIHNDFNNRFINFVLISSFNKMIIEKDHYYSLWCAYLGNKNKIIIIPHNTNENYYIDNWYKQ